VIVRLVPTTDDEDVVVAKIAPRLLPTIGVVGDRAQKERESGGRGQGARGHEQAAILGRREIVERRRRVDAQLFESVDVVIDAHVAVVDGCHDVGGRGDEIGIQSVDLAHVRVEDVGVERSAEQCVVHSPHDVALGIACGQRGLGDHFARVAGGDDPHRDAGLVREGVEDSLGGRERFVGHDGDGDVFLRGVVRGAGDGRRQSDRGEGERGRSGFHGFSLW